VLKRAYVHIDAPHQLEPKVPSIISHRTALHGSTIPRNTRNRN